MTPPNQPKRCGYGPFPCLYQPGPEVPELPDVPGPHRWPLFGACRCKAKQRVATSTWSSRYYKVTGPICPPILGLFRPATPPGSALTILNLPGINRFCSSCSRWLQLPTVALEDLPRRPSVTLQPQNTAVVFFSAKVRPDDQDTQQRCEQSDKKADA